MDHPFARAIDLTALGTIIAAFIDVAPKLAAVAALVWWLVRIYYEIRTGEKKLREGPRR
jgi:hypothetical protein